MRARFADELVAIEQRLVRELDEVGHVLELIAERMLERADGDASHLGDVARHLRMVSRRVDEQLIAVTAHQAPVAGDLRLVLSLIQLAHRASLIANQFELIAAQLAEVDPDARDPQRTARQLSLMAELAGRQVQHATRAFAARDSDSAIELEAQDDALDRINRQVFEATYALDADERERELALRYVLIARSLERIGDNAVDIAEQAVFLVTAELQEFTDASRPKRPRPVDPDVR
jgi:phosphate transport system protein